MPTATATDSVSMTLANRHVLLVTGRFAESLARKVAAEVAPQVGFTYEVHVLPISVAALMHVDWVIRKLVLPVGRTFDVVLLPGWCLGDLESLNHKLGVPVARGPKDILDLPQFCGLGGQRQVDLSARDIEIIAEINHAPRLTEADLYRQAGELLEQGADLIDLGCIPGESWGRVGHCVRELVARGVRVSIDSFEQREVEAAVEAGANLVLSCNQSNLSWARQLNAELVAIPDHPHDLDSLGPTIESLREAGRPFRIDPILEPIGHGFAASLARYQTASQRWPDLQIMMGIGNVTELTEVDSAGVNFLLAAICQELRICSVLTTQVINWARSSVREFDLARRLVKYAVDHKALPKHVDSRLVMLRDAKLRELGDEALQSLATQIRDANFRIFVERGQIHIMNRDGHWTGVDPFELFEQFSQTSPVDASHAFYLGYELAKAVTALTLGKQYHQDNALNWGFLTVPERSPHHERKSG